MKIEPALEQGILLKRYKRFLTDVRLPDGSEMTIHCPNTGSMKACLAEGELCWFSRSDNPKRKYPCTWEIATTPAGDLAGINTGRANALVVEAVEAGVIEPLQGYSDLRTEVRYGDERSRIDILLERNADTGVEQCFVEVKNVTLCVGGGQGLFPDAVSTRGTKHLRELSLMVQRGHRAVLLFCVQHTGIDRVAPAVEIDPDYAAALREAVATGVEVYAYRARISPEEIALDTALPVEINPE